MAPAISLGLGLLNQRLAPKHQRVLSDAARRDLANDLLDCLSRTFSSFLDPVLALSPQSKHSNLCDQQLFLDALRAFPGVKDAVSRVVSSWVNAQYLLVSRFAREHQLIRNRFKDALPLPISRLDLSLSDPHQGYTRTACLTFQDRTGIIYKPRRCLGERRWFRLLNWLNSQGFKPAFLAVRVVPRRNYGWMQFIPARACSTTAGSRRYYFRFGAQLALSQLLHLADLHRENWVRHGQHPVLVDVESYGPDSYHLFRQGRRKNLPAILRTGILPYQRDEISVEVAALPDAAAALAKQLPLPHRHAIICGYRALIAFIFNSSQRMKALTSHAVWFAQDPKRRLFIRSSAEYRCIIQASLHPARVSDGEIRRRYLLNTCLSAAPAECIARFEVAALLCCTIPRLTAEVVAAPHSTITMPNRRQLGDSLARLRLLLGLATTRSVRRP